ncbi:hypothetical protein BKI52_23300 [marine bacterium AO1-C]|nr:hypothetical protein BKI52_23300 [marine bacterium AO1-C]
MNVYTPMPSSVDDSQQQIKGYTNRKEIVRWLLQEPQEIRFTLTPSLNRFHRPDDFIFTAANQATAMMMGRPLEHLIGHKLIEVLNIHPFHHFFQNYLRTYLYNTPLQQNIEMPILSRKHKRIVHEANVVDGALEVIIKVAPKEIEALESTQINETEQIAQPMQPLFEEASEVVVSSKPIEPILKKDSENVVVQIAEANTDDYLPINETTHVETVDSIAQDEPGLEETVAKEMIVEDKITDIDPLASQQVSMDGKIEYINEAICDTLELEEYNRQEVFMQDILHKVSQLPYHFALLQAKAQQVVKNLPLIFVTKSKKYVKVKGRIEPQTKDGQVTGLRFYYQVLQHTPDFHQVAAFGKVPAFNSF